MGEDQLHAAEEPASTSQSNKVEGLVAQAPASAICPALQLQQLIFAETASRALDDRKCALGSHGGAVGPLPHRLNQCRAFTVADSLVNRACASHGGRCIRRLALILLNLQLRVLCHST